MGDRTLVVWDDALLHYDFGATHPMHPMRLELTMALARSVGVLDAPGVSIAAPAEAADELLELVHAPAYLAAVRFAPHDEWSEVGPQHGLGTDDNPVFPGMHEAAALITGGSVDAAAAIWRGDADHAVNLAGGMHHAMRSRAAGFCIYNDAAVAIAWLLANGAQRVAYVDVDVHHGDGVQAAFEDDDRVLTISLHQTPLALFPGTGFPEDVGTGRAEGTAGNVALPVGTRDSGWLRAFSGVVPVLLREFAPDVLVTQCGSDAHARDPLADLMLSVDGQRRSYELLHDLAHEVAGGRWLALGGGGYALDVVPRAWTALLATATGTPLPTATPARWQDLYRARTGNPAPATMTDGVEVSYAAWEAGEGDPDDPLDRAVAATRRHVLPLHGLDPWRDR